MPDIRADDRFEWPAHLQKWCPSGALSHFGFHRERAAVAPRHLKLPEIQAMVKCEVCPDGGRPARGGPSGAPCRCAVCVERGRK